ncbi:MAG: Gfo/Idh/MocA family oxidoreductase [Lachnospiraceae bacterium]|nr:Gfo/Idh/MocA family oxidoreductase [Lachnospiraceae bacterium]
MSDTETQQLKAGIIGCGSISEVHAGVLSKMKKAALTVLCDTDEAKAKARRDMHPECDIKIYTDWKELIDSDVDVFHICTPHYLHAPMAAELLKAGKAVFLEKPCAISEEQFEVLKAADREHPGKLGICFQNRYNETTEIADRVIKEGKIGNVIGARGFVTWKRDEDYYTKDPWKGYMETSGGGALINQSIHTLDLVLRYLGEPVSVKASLSNHHLPGWIEVEDTVDAVMEFKGGARACFYASNGYSCDAPVIIEIQGDKGRLTINANTVLLNTESGDELLTTKGLPGFVKDYWGRGHQACIEDFYDCLITGREFPVNLASAENSFKTMMEIYSFR